MKIGLFVFSLFTFIPLPVLAQDIAVSGAYAFATAAEASNGAVFMTILNETGAKERLTGAFASVAKKAELHTMSMDGGIMRMRKVDFYELAPGAETELSPMGKHIMLITLNAPLMAGKTFPLTLSFENHGDITVDVAVVPPGQKSANKHEKSSYP